MLAEILKPITALLSCAAGLWMLLRALPRGFSEQERITAYEPTAEKIAGVLCANTKRLWAFFCMKLFAVALCSAALLKGFVWCARTAHMLHELL